MFPLSNVPSRSAPFPHTLPQIYSYILYLPFEGLNDVQLVKGLNDVLT
jgi:hypothetical protein